VPTPVVLFGAFDRHNLGDLLLAQVAAALLPGRELRFAGLAERDLRSCGGHPIEALTRLAAEWGGPPPLLLHVGGETLTCSAWQAAAMLLPPAEAGATIGYLEHRTAEREAWVRQMVGTPARAPYVVGRDRWPGVAAIVHAGVGGIDLDTSDVDTKAEVLASLASADAVGVRDRHTLAHLTAAGIDACLMPDPAVLVCELFADRIAIRGREGELARLRRRFAAGYLAVQFGAEFADDGTLGAIATALDAVSREHGLGTVFFRAGAAPWHDDLDALNRTALGLRHGSAAVFESLDLWDLCALIAGSRAYCGSSLHGRIVALAFGLPRVTLRPEGAPPGKQAAFAAAWDPLERSVDIAPRDLAAALDHALTADPAAHRARALALAARCRRDFEALCKPWLR